MSGEAERSAFKTLREKTAKSSGEICRLILMKMLPALEERDIEAFGNSLTRIQRLVGESFSAIQGGTFSNPAGASCIRLMLREGAHGAGQSSWGPTVYGLVQGVEAAEVLREKVKRFISRGAGGEVFYAAANNRGACIRAFE
jgi:beta-RFAP synthase